MLDDGSEPITVEQYALSIALKECTKQMVEAKQWIGHYWHYKYFWCRYIADFFVYSYRERSTLEEELQRIKYMNLKWIHRRILLKRAIAKLVGKPY
jgi:hypothetical protein